MIPVSVAAVSASIARRITVGLTASRCPSRTVARTTWGSISRPPLATALAAVAICSGVTLTW